MVRSRSNVAAFKVRNLFIEEILHGCFKVKFCWDEKWMDRKSPIGTG